MLRLIEYNNFAKLPLFDIFKQEYTLVQEFNVEDKLRQYEFLPGRRSLQFDANYGVFRRNPPHKVSSL